MIFSIFRHSEFSFEGQHAGERLELLLYRHWFTLVGPFVGVALGALLPIIGLSLFGATLHAYGILGLAIFVASIYYLFLWAGLFYVITMYCLDTWIVTNERIIVRSQKGFFNQTISELHLSRIQDVSVNCSGLIQTMLNFGDLEVQSAGAENRFFFKQIPHPKEVNNLIAKLVKAAHLDKPGV